MQLIAYLIGAVAPAMLAMAYNDNCDGSLIPANKDDCLKAISNVDTSATYNDGSQFSEGECYLVYATNGSGDQPVSGQKIHDVAQAIVDNCDMQHGSFGTENCNSCHVTVNYRS
ncbi:hypothetical protein DTO013E5_8341 [Penicillium roqueforti]|uniref:Genomic scaffold, ProqFM164S02 n=1 Tax=Penicillium roqueforti (strain FM164) TaxID=1365484 RepID=W6QK42_PENRF|nr:uncharacterized protein LCP9604111_8854 [Penicillium roqueforti]XP_057043511.1 uncharacterized protein N7518_001133 [Penicillium psychrosexuale]CDM29947.1 unnamed protein product [Penicillium roqueforti FM164]KAF9240090.1 hypothetical protein LCP9604111_8854 [Penicillium roqueforti]KAI1831963.1 hypothetical protein CBS147337_7409 [Penicillium roqueforti]KAI2670650.1 hypothetical protein CBS147355_9181 [Penicillium roqueforti]KAI2677557.1 hypothetical protein LCP963914a_7849 [Penicillium ro